MKYYTCSIATNLICKVHLSHTDIMTEKSLISICKQAIGIKIINYGNHNESIGQCLSAIYRDGKVFCGVEILDEYVCDDMFLVMSINVKKDEWEEEETTPHRTLKDVELFNLFISYSSMDTNLDKLKEVTKDKSNVLLY